MNSRLWLAFTVLFVAATLPLITASLTTEASEFLRALNYGNAVTESEVCGTAGASYGLKCDSNKTLISVNMTRWSSCSENTTLATIPSSITTFVASGCFLSGSISSGLAPSLSLLNLSSTNVSGTIPTTLTKLETLDLSGTLINTSIPSTLTKLTTLILTQVTLQGSIPKQLSKLERLDLSRTTINTGSFIAEIPPELKKLTYLNLANTLTLGEIPSTLSNLVTLNLMNTGVSGEVPSTLTKLNYLDISGTDISSVPPTLTKLESLYASSSSLEGDLDWLPSLTALRYFSAAGSRLTWNASNIFTGQSWVQIDLSNTLMNSTTKVPSTFKIGSALVYLDLSSTSMVGTITSGMFSSATSLQVLRLSNNPKLTGDLKFLASSPRLVELRLRSSNFKGALTLNTPNMETVSLSSNKVTAFTITSVAAGAYIDLSKNAIQSGIITAANLAFLNVSSNQLSTLSLSSTIGSLDTLDLSNNLFASIPSTISDGASLAFLNISSNMLTGSIPTVLPPTLVDLDLSNNSISGSIESESWGYMKTINLHMNELSGDVRSFASFPGLVTLQLQDNHLTGTLIAPPRSLVTLRAQNNYFTSLSVSLEASDPLQVLDVSNNSLSGDLNTILPSALITARLHDNDFTGSINLAPSMPNLLELRLSNNALSGSIAWPADAKSVRELHLDNNQFSGSMSTALSQLIGLVNLNLSYNQFEGTIPSFAGYYTVSDIDLGFNRFNGSLPDLSNSTDTSTVVNIALGSNSLTGSIPTSWFTSQLRSIDLSQNQLSGALWNSLFQEPMKLRRLNLSHNGFSGTMVPMLDITRLTRLDLSNNTLSKALPTWLRNVTYINVIGNGFATTIPPLDKVKTLLAYGNRLDLCAYIPSSAPVLRNCDLLDQTVCLIEEGCQDAYENLGCTTTHNQTCLPCLSTKPGTGFFCEFGKWVSIGVNTTGAIVTGGGVTVIEGNMTVTNGSIIVISNSTLSVQGCSDLSGNATLVVTETDIEQWTKNRTSAFKTILSSAQGWCSSIPLLSLGVQYPSSPCRSVTYRTESTSSAIIVYFDVSNNGCFRWWPVILGVTLGIFIFVVLIAVFFRVNKNAAQMIWPYMKNEEELPVFEALEEEHEMRSFLTEPLLTGGSEMDTVDLH